MEEVNIFDIDGMEEEREIFTNHGYVRSHERTSMKNEEKLLRFVRCARERGTRPEDLEMKWQRDFVGRRARQDVYYRIYNNYLFAFSKTNRDRLITMFALPNSFTHHRSRFGQNKEWIRNPRIYRRMYGCREDPSKSEWELT